MYSFPGTPRLVKAFLLVVVVVAMVAMVATRPGGGYSSASAVLNGWGGIVGWERSSRLAFGGS